MDGRRAAALRPRKASRFGVEPDDGRRLRELPALLHRAVRRVDAGGGRASVRLQLASAAHRDAGRQGRQPGLAGYRAQGARVALGRVRAPGLRGRDSAKPRGGREAAEAGPARVDGAFRRRGAQAFRLARKPRGRPLRRRYLAVPRHRPSPKRAGGPARGRLQPRIRPDQGGPRARRDPRRRGREGAEERHVQALGARARDGGRAAFAAHRIAAAAPGGKRRRARRRHADVRDGRRRGRAAERPDGRLRAAADAAGLPKRHHLHSLRHTYATYLLSTGTSFKEAQELLGHASATTTLNVYGHVVPGRKSEAADAYIRWREGK